MGTADDGIYADPIEYDLESGPVDLEQTVLLDLALQANGPVLEVGCGTGRVTIPLAQRGVEITGLDILPHMIERARQKAGALPVRWVCGDARRFELDTQFALIYTKGGVLQHLLKRSEQEGMLRHVYKHLSAGGRFVVDAWLKPPPAMVDSCEEAEWFSYVDRQDRVVQVIGADRYDHLRQIWYQRWRRRWHENGVERFSAPIKLALRYFMPREMEALLYYNGFEIVSSYGSWLGAPLDETSRGQIYVCKPRSAAMDRP